jgi:hypothetical protein
MTSLRKKEREYSVLRKARFGGWTCGDEGPDFDETSGDVPAKVSDQTL